MQQKATISTVIKQFVPLKKGANYYYGLCPFHTERKPHFHVYDRAGTYKCTGCGRSGNAIKFLMEHLKLTNWQAIAWLTALNKEKHQNKTHQSTINFKNLSL